MPSPAQAEPRESHDKTKVTLTGAEQTLLITLYARARDAESPNPILNDQHAVQAVSRLRNQGYDLSSGATQGGGGGGGSVVSVAVRARVMDQCVGAFLARHPGPATVLHLACGMDSRSLRVGWQGEGRVWIDADTEEAVGLRRQIMDDPVPRTGEYRLLSPKITEDGWLKGCDIPTDRPLMVVCEGLTMYLTADQNRALLRSIVKFSQEQMIDGQILFDTLGSVFYYLVTYVFAAQLSLAGYGLHWYLSNAKALERNVTGLKFKERVFKMQDLQLGRNGLIIGWILWLMDWLHLGDYIGGIYLYVF